MDEPLRLSDGEEEIPPYKTDFEYKPYYEYRATRPAFCDDIKEYDPERYAKFEKQIEDNGFSNSELWNLDVSIAIFVYPRLRQFRDNLNGYPGSMTEKEWVEILDKMLYAFELIIDDCSTFDKEKQEQINEGLKLFGENLQCLWD